MATATADYLFVANNHTQSTFRKPRFRKQEKGCSPFRSAAMNRNKWGGQAGITPRRHGGVRDTRWITRTRTGFWLLPGRNRSSARLPCAPTPSLRSSRDPLESVAFTFASFTFTASSALLLPCSAIFFFFSLQRLPATVPNRTAFVYCSC